MNPQIKKTILNKINVMKSLFLINLFNSDSSLVTKENIKFIDTRTSLIEKDEPILIKDLMLLEELYQKSIRLK